MAKIYYNKDADLKVLKGKRVAVVGYGIQGRAQSLNLRDSGLEVVLGLNLKDETWKRAKADKMKIMSIPDAVKSADIVMMLIPDEVQKSVYDKDVAPYLKEGMALDFAHGFNIHFKRIVPPKNIDVIMVAPKGPGALVRETFLAGIGVPALIAVYQDHSGNAKRIALALAKGLMATSRGVIETTFKEETETDLFGEQVDLCGGSSALVKTSFDVLVEAGYQPEIAYFEVLHELKLIIDLVQKGGIEGMWDGVSNTAEYGGRTRGGVIIDDRTKETMKDTLRDIQSGKFAAEWVAEHDAGMPTLTRLREEGRKSQIEAVGRRIRKMFE
jgi:ketol-acid reductoisomerase